MLYMNSLPDDVSVLTVQLVGILRSKRNPRLVKLRKTTYLSFHFPSLNYTKQNGGEALTSNTLSMKFFLHDWKAAVHPLIWHLLHMQIRI